MTGLSLLAWEGTVLVVRGPAVGLLGLTGGLQDLFEVLDILHGLVENVHFGHFLDHGSSGHMSPQGLEASVDRLDSVPLSLVPLDSLVVRSLVNSESSHVSRLGSHPGLVSSLIG